MKVNPVIPFAIFSAAFIFTGTGDLRPALIFLFSIWIGTLWVKWIEKKY